MTLHRDDDDVTKTASVSTAVAGDTVDYEITVQPNVTTPTSSTRSSTPFPTVSTIDPASVTGGGVVDGQTITWEVPCPRPVGAPAPTCRRPRPPVRNAPTWAGFLDLGAAGIPFAGLDGDTSRPTPSPTSVRSSTTARSSPNLVVAEDGLVTVAGGYGGEPWVPQAIPNADLPNGVFAPLWSDLELSRRRTAAACGWPRSPPIGAAIVQWDNPFEFTGDDTVGPSVGTFQAWIYNTVDDSRPEMTFEYDTSAPCPRLPRSASRTSSAQRDGGRLGR